MWMRYGHICGRKDLILECRGTRLGVNAISTCSTRMATSCRLLGRYNELAKRMCPDEVCVAAVSDQRPPSGDSARVPLALRRRPSSGVAEGILERDTIDRAYGAGHR